MALNKTVVINVVGLTKRLLGDATPFLSQWAGSNGLRSIEPVLPAVTCTAQSTYLTGALPSRHGIVGNGWFFREELEIKFWRQSNRLVQAPKLWEVLREHDRDFTCANLFWWYNMYSSVDYSVTPRPVYHADGRKTPDCYSHPADLRDRLQAELGQFPLFKFWGPLTSIESSRWIAEASRRVDAWHDPTLSLIYLPHLDYNLQRRGHDWSRIASDLRQIDDVCRELVEYYEGRGARVVLLSEYGITDVDRPVHLNRVLREAGLLAIRNEPLGELLDAGASRAFAVADHQVAHVYVGDADDLPRVRGLLEAVPGVGEVLDRQQQARLGLDHERAGDFVVFSDARSWFTHYYWMDDDRAPDFARTVEIHRKPGYDPVELFIDPRIRCPRARLALKLLRKRLGFRTLMDVIPLDATLVRGSHGRRPDDPLDWPVLAGCGADDAGPIAATDVFDIITARTLS